MEQPWLDWAIELQALAQAGLHYSKDVFDLERFARIRGIAAEMVAAKSRLDMTAVEGLFCNETGYQTPKLETRAAIFEDGSILLVKERLTGKWSLPGGWVDADLSVYGNTVKECREEAGLDVEPLRLIALQDLKQHHQRPYAYGITKVFVLCKPIAGDFSPNSETLARGYFPLDALPELDEDKVTAEQIALCFEAAADENWAVRFD